MWNFTQTPNDRAVEAAARRSDLQATTWNSTFARSIFEATNGNSSLFGYDQVDVASFIDQDICRSDLLRQNLDVNAMEDAYWQANPLSGESPRGCYTGCILGTGTYEALVRSYGIRRTMNFESWSGKCFDEIDPSSVTNRIKLNYGAIMERIFPRLAEPIELFPGTANVETSNFDGSNSVVVNYSSFDHEFQFMRDEIRPIYPGVWLGRMYAMPGMSMFGGVLQVPIGATPVYTVSFLLVGEPQSTMPLIG
jgi:hypothetical protein